jgi:hypothetical protein
MAALSTIHDVTGRRLVSSIYRCEISMVGTKKFVLTLVKTGQEMLYIINRTCLQSSSWLCRVARRGRNYLTPNIGALKSICKPISASDVNLILTFFHVYALMSKLIDQPVWSLVKNIMFLHTNKYCWEPRWNVENLNIYRVKTKASKRWNHSFRFLLSFYYI